MTNFDTLIVVCAIFLLGYTLGWLGHKFKENRPPRFWR